MLFRFATDDETNAALHAVQESGEAWMGGTRLGRPGRDSHLDLHLADERRRRGADDCGLRRPARGAVERAFEPTAEDAFEPARHLDERVDVDAGAHAVTLELPHEILRRDVPGRVR